MAQLIPRPAAWSVLPLTLTVLLALGFLAGGLVHPAFNYDLLPYAALSKEMRGAGGKLETYRELRAQLGRPRFEKFFLQMPYRERMLADDAFFDANLPFYRVKPLYVFLCSLVARLIGSDVVATSVVSSIATAAAVLLSCVIVRRMGAPTGSWQLALPLSWAVAGGLTLARLSTPDALAAFLTLLLVWIALAESWTAWRAASLILVAGLAVAARIETVLFVVALCTCEAIFRPHHRRVALITGAAALASYLTINRLMGSYGYVALLNFTFVDHDRLLVPDLVPHVLGYLRAVVFGIVELFSGGDGPGGLLLLAVGLSAAVAVREWRLRAVAEGGHFRASILALSAALVLYLVARFVLFPEPAERFMTGAYVLAGVLFARAVQPPSQTIAGPQYDRRQQSGRPQRLQA
jgi:hypothetical protein